MLAGISVGSAIAGPAPSSVAAPERDSSFDTRAGVGENPGGDAADVADVHTETDRAPADRSGPRRIETGRTEAERALLDDVRIGDAPVEDRSWRWVLYQELSTGKVRKYRVDADGRMTETLPEESVAVEFLTVYLDQTLSLRERSERIRPYLAGGSALRTMHDPFFRHPPAISVTGESSSGEDDARGDTARTVFVGTDIGDYRVTLSPAETRAEAQWEVHTVLPPASWLHPAAPGLFG